MLIGCARRPESFTLGAYSLELKAYSLKLTAAPEFNYPSLMPLNIRRARLVIAGAAVLLLAVLIGVFLVRSELRKQRLARTALPAQLGINIQQTAQGFTFSKSEGGRTLFSIHASQMVQFRAGGKAELKDVNIIVYGRNSSRFDQIYGSGFEYDQQQQIIRATGEVHIDLQADAEGAKHS